MVDELSNSDANEPPLSPSSVSAGKRRWGFRLLAAGIPTVLGAALFVAVMFRIELLVIDPDTHRWTLQSRPIYVQEPGQQVTGHRYLYDAELGWRNIPHWQATTMGQTLTINSLGLRGPEYHHEKPESVRRLLVLGDSYAWGYGVSDQEVFPHQLDSRLDDWEVINTGVSGWGTDQQLLFLKREGVRYAPDVVVVAFFLFNDPKNNVRSLQYGLSKPMFMDTDLKLANVPVPRPSSPPVELMSKASPIELTVAILQEISHVCREHDCRLVFMKFGAFLNLEPAKMRQWEIELESRLQQLPDISYLDLDEEFSNRGLTKQSLLRGNNDGHWNAFGHQQTARILQQFLYDRDLIEP